MITTLVACLVLAGPQGLAQPIDYTTRTKRLDSILADLSKATKLQLECTSDIREEPLILHLNKVPLQEVMDKIAGVFGGEWTKTEKGFRFSYGRQADTWHEAALQFRVKTLTAAIDEKLEQLSSLPPLDEAGAPRLVSGVFKDHLEGDAAFRRMGELSSHVVLKILKKINPRDLCWQKDEEALYYSNEPTAFERELPDCSDEIEEAIALNNLLSNAFAKVDGENARNLQKIHAPPLDHPISKIILRVPAFRAYEGRGGTGSAILSLYDSSGKLAKSIGVSVGVDRYRWREQRTAEEKIRNKVSGGVRLGKHAEEIVPFVLQTQSPQHIRPISEATKSILIVPTQHDPLSLATSDIILGLAEKANLNAVYLSTDFGEAWAYIATRGQPIDLSLFEKILARSGEMKLTVDDKWFVGRPVDPIDALRTRMPRDHFEKFMQAFKGDGYFRLEPVCDLAFNVSKQTNMVFVNYAARYLGNADFNVLGGYITQHFPYAFYGSLTDEQQGSVASGKLRLQKSDLSAAQIELIQDWLINAHKLFPQSTGDKNSADSRLQTLAAEPSVALVRGLGANGYVDIIQVLEETFHFPAGPNADDNPVDIESLAQYVAQSKYEKLSAEAIPDFNRVTAGIRRKIQIVVVLDNGLGSNAQIEDERPLTDRPKPLAQIVDAFSPALRLRYEKALAEATRAYSSREPSSESSPPIQPPLPLVERSLFG